MKRPIRVLYVLNALGGGASLGIYELLRALPPERIVAYAVVPPGPTEQFVGVRQLFADARMIAIPWWNKPQTQGLARDWAIALGHWRRGISTSESTRKIVEFIKEWQIDVVHTGTSLTLSGALAASEAGIPHIWHIKESVGSRNRVRFHLSDNDLVTYMSQRSARIIAMSDYIASIYTSQGCKNISVVPDGVDCTRYTANDSRNLRESLRLSKQETLVGMVASLSSVWKRHDVFVEMVSQLAKSEPNTRFIAIGPMPTAKRWPYDLGKRYFDQLVALTKSQVPDGKLSFLNYVPDPADIMRSLDILVHTCDEEPFGRIAIEAMAAGTPVIGPNKGGIAETIVHGETGFLASARAPSSFAKATQTLIRDVELRQLLGCNGQKRAREHYSLELHAERILSIYENAMGQLAT